MATFKKSEYLLSSMVGKNTDADLLRVDLGANWERDNNGKFQLQTSSVANQGNFTKIKFENPITDHIYESSPYYSITQSITLKSDDSKFKNYSDFVNYINGTATTPPLIKTGSFFLDAHITLPIPYSQQEMKLIENSARPLSYKVDPVYNFYQRNYEDKTVTVPEQILPNLYSVYGSKSDADQSPNTLNDLDSELINIGTFLGNIVGSTSPTNPELEILPTENVGFIKEANPYKAIFPMYNEIEFSTDRSTIFAEIMEDARLSTDLLKYLSDRVNTSNQTRPFAGFREELSVGGNGEVVFASLSSDGQFRTYDVFAWLNGIAGDFVDSDSTSFFTSNGEEDVSFIGPTPDETNKFIKFLNLLKFEGKVQNLVNNYMRNYENILQGIPAYSETVAYKVEKRKAGTLVTTYLFPNSNEIDVYKFVDTQVKYGEKYDYTAYAFQLSMAAEYEYKDVDVKLITNSEQVKPPTVLQTSNTGAGTTNSGGSGGGGGSGGPPKFGGFVTEEAAIILEEEPREDTSALAGDIADEFSKEGE